MSDSRSRTNLTRTQAQLQRELARQARQTSGETEILGEQTGLGPSSTHFTSPYLSEPPPASPPNWVEFDSSRIRRAYYDAPNHVIGVQFVDGTPWHYADVNGEIWKRLKRSKSPGRFVNRVLNGFPYGPGYH